jgi:hypothetical protein
MKSCRISDTFLPVWGQFLEGNRNVEGAGLFLVCLLHPVKILS